MNIVPRWDIKGCDIAIFDIPTRDNIYHYQRNNPILSHEGYEQQKTELTGAFI